MTSSVRMIYLLYKYFTAGEQHRAENPAQDHHNSGSRAHVPYPVGPSVQRARPAALPTKRNNAGQRL